MTELGAPVLGEYAVEGQPALTPAGRVFRGRHLRLDRDVSILALDARIAAEPEFAERFTAALRTAAALDHPHIVHIYDFFERDGRYYIVAERLSGVTVASIIDQRAAAARLLPLTVALDLTRQVAEALAHGHALGIAHGSLTPADLHFDRPQAPGTPAASVKVGGWGLARLQGHTISAPDDVYRLGALLYQLCTGQPFDGGRPAPMAFRPGLPQTIAALIARCLEPEPGLRPSAAAVAEELGQQLREARQASDALPAPDVELAVAPPEAAGSEGASYRALIHNSGNAPGRFTLGVTAGDPELEITFAQNEIVLDPGERTTIELLARAPRRFVGSPVARRFALTAETDGRSAPPQSVTFVHQALISPWLPLAVALLLLVVLVVRGIAPLAVPPDEIAPTDVASVATAVVPTLTLAPMPTAAPTPSAEPGAPVVNLFAVDPDVVPPDGVVLVVWDVAGAERVVIDQFGDVPPSGQREHRPGQTTDYRLVAIKGGQQTTRIERVSVVQPTPEPTLEPTAMPTAVPETPPEPTVAPSPEPTPAFRQPVFLLDLAPQARWEAGGRPIRFGSPRPGSDEASASYMNDVILEDSNIHAITLYTVPPTDTAEFLEGQFNLPAIQEGQHFLADLGFGQGVEGAGVTVEVRFSGEVIFRETTASVGSLLRVQLDLQRFVGRSGRLDLRVSAAEGYEHSGVHWVNPRIDTVPPL